MLILRCVGILRIRRNEMFTLLHLHQIAATRGDGLQPHFQALLRHLEVEQVELTADNDNSGETPALMPVKTDLR